MEEKQNWNPGDNYAQAIELEWSKKNVFSTFAYDCLGCVYGNSSSQRIFLKGEKKKGKGKWNYKKTSEKTHCLSPEKKDDMQDQQLSYIPNRYFKNYKECEITSSAGDSYSLPGFSYTWHS